MKPTTHYITAEELVVINQVVTEESGGMHGLREPGLLNSISIKPQAQFSGKDLYPDIYLKSAVLFEALVNYHVFVDGNKRTAFASLARFLYINGYTLIVSENEIVDYTVSVATDNVDLASIATWIKGHSERIKK